MLSRIKIEMFGVESLDPAFVKGKDVRAMNTRLVEELIRRLLSQRDALIDTVYQPKPGRLDFYVLLKSESYDSMLSLFGFLMGYDRLDIAERYPVNFEFFTPAVKQEMEESNWCIFYNRNYGTSYQAGNA